MQAPSPNHIGISRVAEEPAWADDDFDDDDFDDDHDDPADDDPPGRTWRLLPTVRFVVGMAALGVALAFGWRYSGIEQWALTPATVVAQTSSAATAPVPEGELTRMVGEIEALKKSLHQVIAANQQLTAAVASLQAGQQELKRRTANVQADGWHAQAAAMKYRMVVVQPKGTTGSVKPRPAAHAEVRSAPKPADRAPLQLTSPRP